MDYSARLKHYDCVSRTCNKRTNFLILYNSVIQLYSDFCALKGNGGKIGKYCSREEKLDTYDNMRLILLSILFFSLLFSLSLPLFFVSCLFLPSLPLIFRPFPFIVSFFSFGGEIKDYRAYIFSDGERSTTCECVSACKLVFAPKACEHTSVCDWFLLSRLPWGSGNPTLAPSLPQVSCVLQRLSSLLLSPSLTICYYSSLFLPLSYFINMYPFEMTSIWCGYWFPYQAFSNRKPSLVNRLIRQTMLVNVGKAVWLSFHDKQQCWGKSLLKVMR